LHRHRSSLRTTPVGAPPPPPPGRVGLPFGTRSTVVAASSTR
jgi:hypothetical protein